MSVCWSNTLVFGLEENISKPVWWIAVGIRGPQRMNPPNFGGSLTFPLMTFWVFNEVSRLAIQHVLISALRISKFCHLGTKSTWLGSGND